MTIFGRVAPSLLALLVSTALLGAVSPVGDRSDWEERLARSIPTPEEVVVARSAGGVVATLNEEATRVATRVLEEGGNAIDAAAAAWMVLAVVSPNQTGLGGGGYIHYHDASSNQTYFVDANVRAGMNASPTSLLDETGEPLSNSALRARGMGVGVPGMVRGFDVALRRWGTRHFDELAGSAILLAENGWEVDRELSLRIHQTRENLDEHARAIYLPEGEPLEPGDLLVQPQKARALRLIAEGGSEAFYQGPIAEAVVAHVQELGGFLTLEDFHRYNASVDVPFRFDFGEYQIATNPNIQGGATLATLLGLLAPLDLLEHDRRSAEHYHLLMEATRLASAGTNDYFADPEFVDHPSQALRSREFLDSRWSQFDPDRRNSDIDATNPWDFQVGAPYRTRGHHSDYDETAVADEVGEGEWDEGTDHFTIVDRHGNVVAVTSTLGTAWTAGHMVPEYGFMLNVTGGYFDGEPGGAHEIRGGKRPRSSMTPTLVFRDGEPVMTVGSPSPAGMQHVQVLLNVLVHRMDLAHALAEPRILPGGGWEEGIPTEVLEELRSRGHEMDEEWGAVGAVSVVLKDGHEWIGAADPRRDGVAMGAGPGARIDD
jgi:gamma-glutamyltranspeptidase / glutathione hydrolase